MTKLDAVEALRAVRAVPRFEGEPNVAQELATYCAIKAGWVGAWPGPTGGAIAYLALQPTVWPGGRAESVHPAMWCTVCGKTQKEVLSLVAGPNVNACNECADMLASMGDHVGPNTSMHGVPPCMFCGEETPRVFARHGAVCVPCIAICEQAIAAS